MLKRLTGRDGPLGIFVEYPVLARLACISVCAEIAWGTLIVVLEYYFKDDLLKGNAEQIIAGHTATVLLAFTLCEAVFKVPLGALSDRIGPRPVVLSALLLAAISPVLASQVYHWSSPGNQWYWFIPLRVVDGVAAAALWPSMSAMMARSVPQSAKSAAMSVFNGAYCLGLAIGPLTGLYLGQHIGLRNVFPFCGAVMLVGLAVAFFVLRGHLGQKPAAGEAHSAEAGLAGLSMLRGHPLLGRMMCLYALSQTAVGILGATLPLYLSQHFGIEKDHLPRLVAGPALVVAAIALPLGRLGDSIGRVKAVRLSYTMAALGMLLVALTGQLPDKHPHVAGLLAPTASQLLSGELIFALGMILLVGCYIIGTPAWLGLTSVQVDNSRQAEALSLMQTAQGLGVVVGLGMVASAAPLLARTERVAARAGHAIGQGFHKGAAHLHNFHLPGHAPNVAVAPTPMPAPVAIVVRSVSVVPVSIWLWVACVVFMLCLAGTILYIHESDAAHAEAKINKPPDGKQPAGASSV